MKNKLLLFAITICILIGCNNKTEKSDVTTTDTIAVPKIIDSTKMITEKTVDKKLLTPEEVGNSTGDQPSFSYMLNDKFIAMDDGNGHLLMAFNGKTIKLKFNKKLSSPTVGIFISSDYKIEFLLSKPYRDGEPINGRSGKIKIYYKNDSLEFPIKANDDGPWSIFEN
ncbi:MAG: hypothetical protein IPP81_19150 [Chitinophagaceae bacterium]|nr:hypothetical protein [Chitinophagaceae bacterium]